MNEPPPSSEWLQAANSHLESRDVPIRLETLTYINRDHEAFIGLTAPIRAEDLSSRGFRPWPRQGAISMVVREGDDPWTVAWRPSQTDRILCCAVEGLPGQPRVQEMLHKLE